MSLHYEFMLAFDLREDTPADVIAFLQYLTRTEDSAYDAAPPAPITDYYEPDDSSWRELLQSPSALSYGAGAAFALLAVAPEWRQRIKRTQYTLTIRAEALDDDFYQLWWPMLGWLAPYSATEGWVGYYREEGDQQPTLLYFEQGHVYLSKIPDGVSRERLC